MTLASKLLLPVAAALLCGGAAAAGSPGSAGPPGAPASRWYTPAQVARGQALFHNHCARCHGERAEGQAPPPPGMTGGKPGAPPLDGTGHSALHSLDDLQGFISRGRGAMPPFANTLTAEDQRAIVAFMQSLWAPAVYEEWRRGPRPHPNHHHDG